MIGRDAAPGAKLEPVMPGLENNRSPSVLAGVRRSSSFGTTVTVANWSVTIGSAPSSGAGRRHGVSTGASGTARAFRRAARARARRIGLGAVTTMGRKRGFCACTSVAATRRVPRTPAACPA